MSEKSSTEDLSQIPMADDEVDSDDVLDRNNPTESSTPRSVPGNFQKLHRIKCSDPYKIINWHLPCRLSIGFFFHFLDFIQSNFSLSPPMSLVDTDQTQVCTYKNSQAIVIFSQVSSPSLIVGRTRRKSSFNISGS